MRIKHFEIQNFKGVANTTIHLDGGNPGNVTTLIGLNESGKTTILEALSKFVSADRDTAHLVGTLEKKNDVKDFIQKDRKAAFTGEIVVSATVQLEEQDIRLLAAYLYGEHGVILDHAKVQREVVVSKVYLFSDSEHTRTSHLWGISFRIKKKTARKFEHCSGRDKPSGKRDEIWLSAVKFLAERLPKVVYFPTFLFDFPSKIYLEDDHLKDDEAKRNAYYKQVIEDVMKGMPGKLEIQKHIIDRLKRVRGTHKDAATFLAFLFQRDEKQQIDAVLHAVSNEITRTVLGAWAQILEKPTQDRRVQVDWGLEPSENNSVYLEVSIVDRSSKYQLSERSLGFRWFFSFLLFTQFRSGRSKSESTIFLFDEPAANLHSRAQMKLLDSFMRISRGDTRIIYSTHSHYMINPLWLEKAYIIENKALDFETDEDTDLHAVSRTVIDAIRYRTFVGTYPKRTTYFQPVLDTLKVSFSPLMKAAHALIVEGKYDFHPLVYLHSRNGKGVAPDIFPVGGAGNAAELISLFRGWRVNFRLVLDDDKAGRDARARYQEICLLSDNEVVTLGQISNHLVGQPFEAVYQKDVVDLVKNHFGVTKPTKRHYAMYFQELLANDSEPELVDTLKTFEPISAWINSEFPELA